MGWKRQEEKLLSGLQARAEKKTKGGKEQGGKYRLKKVG